jgi:hydrogenase maturation protease
MCCKETDLAAAAREILVIGYGNTLRGDDGAGPAVIEKLSALLPPCCHRRVELISHTQLTPELSAEIALFKRVVFVDASMTLPPGRITISRVHEEAPSAMLFGHHFTPGKVLAMAQCNFGACPDAWVAALGCQCLEISDQLTPRIAAAVDRLVQYLINGFSLWFNGQNFLPEIYRDSEPAITVQQQ